MCLWSLALVHTINNFQVVEPETLTSSQIQLIMHVFLFVHNKIKPSLYTFLLCNFFFGNKTNANNSQEKLRVNVYYI